MFLIPLLQHLAGRAPDEDGAITVEYGTLIALVGVVLVGAVMAFGDMIEPWLRSVMQSVIDGTE
jgi:Flp pilus assembly pilin Flp